MILAVGLLVLYCAGVLAIVGGLLYGALLQQRDGWTGFAVLMAVGAVALAWVALPHPRRRPKLGVRIRGAEQPELFDVIDEVARDLGVDPVDEVHLVPLGNLFVSEHGLPRRRVLYIGFPALALVDEPQLRAILAHELAHFRSGDTRAGRWVLEVNVALRRMLRVGQHRSSLAAWLVTFPFRLFADLFQLITSAVGRAEEYAADAAAAELVGAPVMAQMLRTMYRADAAWWIYLTHSVQPVLDAGAQPPLAAGLSRAFQTSRLQTSVDHMLEARRRPYEHLYGTHPSLEQRLAALGDPRTPAQGPPTIGLLRDLEDIEDRILASLDHPSDLPLTTWETAVDEVLLPAYRRGLTDGTGQRLAIDVEQLGDLVTSMPEMLVTLMPDVSPRIARRAARELDPELFDDLLARALTVTLADAGWRVELPLGGVLTCRRRRRVIEPFFVIEQLRGGGLTPAEWRETARALGVADLALA
jgi:Zn-dependent protease with chaperone function